MSLKSRYLFFIATLFAVFFFTQKYTYAQTNMISQFTENKLVSAVATNNPKNVTTSTDKNNSSIENLTIQLQAQQAEINTLRQQIEKLEALLEKTINKPVIETTSANNTKLSPEPSINPPLPSIKPSPIAKRAPSELLPDLGHIGAEVGLMIGGSQNPFQSNEGFFAGGFIDLPVKRVKGGKISYEIMIGAQRTITQVQSTSGVIALVNSALNTALGNPPSVNNLLSPLPVTNRVKERLTVLTVVPASFKYTMLSFDKQNIRPYVVVGLGTYVGLSSQKLVDFDAGKFVNNPALASLLNALLNGAQVGGLAPIAPELRSRGLSAGQGDFRFGLNAGGGLEFRISPRFSLGFDYRVNKLEGKNGTFSTFTAKPTVHF
jgi:hypothetical protein